MAESYISELGDSLSHGVSNTNGDRVKIIAPKLYNDGNGNHPSIATALSEKVSKSGDTMTGGLEIQGVKSGTSYAQSGGGYNANYNNIILRGDPTYGTSGILFTSSKGTTSINQATDRGFIQFHSMGVTPVAEASTPTMATSGEANSLVIGVGNDSDDEVWIQAPATNGIKHIVGPTKYTIYDAANLPAATSASAVATTSSAGSASSFSRGDHVHSISLATGDNDGQVKIAGSNVNVAGWNKVTQTADDATDSAFEVLLSNTADNTTRTETARKSSRLTLNTKTGTLSVGGPITRTLAKSGTIAETDVLAVSGSTDGFKITYEATASDAGVARIGVTDDENAKLLIGNWGGANYTTFYPAISIMNGRATPAITINNGSAAVTGTLSGTATTANYLNYNNGNEINFRNTPSSGNKQRVWFNYVNGDTNAVDADNPITEYKFGNRNHETTGVTLYADNFTGNAASATTAQYLYKYAIGFHRPEASGGDGKKWCRVATLNEPNIAAGGIWYGVGAIVNVYVNPYGNARTLIGCYEINFRIGLSAGSGYSLKTSGSPTVYLLNGPENLGTVQWRIVRSDTKVEYFILNDEWDSTIYLEKVQELNGAGTRWVWKIENGLYTPDEFTTYCSDKVTSREHIRYSYRSNGTNIERKSSLDYNSFVQGNGFIVGEIDYNGASNAPNGSQWFYNMSFRGDDAAYAGQIALGMTGTVDLYIRNETANSWKSWQRLLKASEVTSTYSSTGTAPVNGTAVASAISGKADKASVTAATKCKITYNSQGIVTAGADLVASDIPSLDAAKITSGTFGTARIADDAITAAKVKDNETLPVNISGAAAYPTGFTSRLTSWSWGTLIAGNGYTQMSSWKTTNGSQMAFAEQLLSGAPDWSVSVQIDGKFYQNEGKYRVLDTSNVSVPSVPTLAWNTESTLATIDGKNVKVKMPANPNTDTKQNITLATTTKAFITGVSTTPTGTAQALTGLADTGVYLTTTAGQLHATTFDVNSKCTLQFNATTNALDFVFA